MIPGGAEAGVEYQEVPLPLEAHLERIGAIWGEENIPEFKVNPETTFHVAVICDGNRRWAVLLGLEPWDGHRAGVETIKGIIRAAGKWDIQILSLWVLSTENLQREPEQVEFLMDLASHHLRDEEVVEELVKNEVKFSHWGDKSLLPDKVVQALEDLEERTANFNQRRVNLAMAYGGINEIERVGVALADGILRGDIDPRAVRRYPQVALWLSDLGEQSPPDLVIRTGMKEGELPRTSGFGPFAPYAVYDFRGELFPEFSPQDFKESIEKFEGYQRRMGK